MINRQNIIDNIIPYVEKDSSIVLLVCDMGFSVIDKFKEKFPDKIFNMGIMEQGTVGIAAGMAISELRPIVYLISNFLVYRALEQIRNDVVLQDLNVKFIGTGTNNYFGFLGQSHCCGEDDIKIMKLIDMPVFDSKQFEKWIISSKAGYIRV